MSEVENAPVDTQVTKPRISLEELKGHDVLVLMDQSGSMGKDSTKFKGKTRWQEGAESVSQLARLIAPVDADGITVITFGSEATVFDGVTPDKVEQIFESNSPSGSTNLTAALDAAFAKKLASGKPALIFVYTDGQPDDPQGAMQSIIDFTKKLEADADAAVQFIQVGNDPTAAAYLQKLDDDLQGMGAKFDIVNTLTCEQADKLTIEELCYQAFND